MVSQQGVENIVINIFLLVIYILLFGRPSIEKYLHKGVIILTHEEHPPTITPPGNVFEESQDSCNSVPTITVINIIPLNWELTEKAFCDEGQNGEDFIKCIEEKAPWALSKSEVITDTTTQIKVQPYFLTTFFELVQSLDIEAGKIKKSPFSDPLKITLNSTKPYYVVITDSKLALVNANPDVLPRSFLILNPYSGVEVLAYMKVRTQNYTKKFLQWYQCQAIRHEKLNLPGSRCEVSPEYNFARCVELSIMAGVGCQPPWRRFSLADLPLCSNWTMLREGSWAIACALSNMKVNI